MTVALAVKTFKQPAGAAQCSASSGSFELLHAPHRRSQRLWPRRRAIAAQAKFAAEMEKHSVVSIGEALFDCLADQLGKSKEDVTSWTPYPGGAPANVATALARLGIHAIFVGALGTDELGDRFMALLNERDVDTSATQRNAHPTRDVLVTRSPDGDREFAGFGAAASSEYADAYLDAQALPLSLLAEVDVLVSGTLGLARPGSATALQEAVAAAKSGGRCTVVIDVNWRPVFWDDAVVARAKVMEFVRGADILKVSDEEVEWLYGIPKAAALEFPERVLEAAPSARGVLVSAGDKGSSYAFRAPGGKMHVTGAVPVMNIDVVDTTGAGDCYLAGFIFYMLMSGGLDALVADAGKLQRAARFATACGAAICRHPGAIEGQPTAADVEKLLQAAGWNT